jgi:urease accessory protein
MNMTGHLMRLNSILKLLRWLVPAAAALLASPAFAHVDASHGFGFGAGLSHPLLGADHLVALLATGIWMVQQQGRMRWLLPVLFVLSTGLGTVAGQSGLALPALEMGLAMSVTLTGLLSLFLLRLPLAPAGLLLSLSGLLHGFAHGLEMPSAAHFPSFAAGLFVSSVALIALGVVLGSRIQLLAGRNGLRAAGAGLAVFGAGLLLNLI